MAEVLAGLLTSAVVGVAKDKLASAMAENANLLWNFKDDLKDMEGMLESISAALQDAERRSVEEKLVQLWLKRLKNAALDISDTLEDYQDKELTATIPRASSCLPIACKKISLDTRMKSMREELNEINKQFQDFNFKQDASISSTEQHDDVRERSCLPDQPMQLKYLLAPRMQIEVLPGYISELAKLQYLDLNGSSSISALPESIGKLDGCLEFLGLSGCSGISKLPSSIGDLKCLKHLNMSGCSGINELPDSIGDLTNLQHLDLSQCSRLKVIPESLCALTHLQYLNLSSCECIKRLPEAIGSLVDLQHLNMSECGVRELPESFNRLSNLLYLELTRCFIKKRLVGALRGLTALQHLSLSSGVGEETLEMDDLPDAMRYLTNLKHLDLSGYFIDGFEINDGYLDFIGTLTNLEHLDLSLNFFLESLPESIGNLKRLHTLNLQYCERLKSLPESIGGATGLKSLVLDDCSHQVIDQASSLFHYSLTLPLFKVGADDVGAKSNLHLLQGENDVGGLKIICLENVIFLEEAQRLKLVTKQNLVDLTLSWTVDADRHLEDMDLLGELELPMSLKSFCLEGYRSPSFSGWIMDNSHHLPALQKFDLCKCPNITSLPEGMRQLSSLQFLRLEHCDSISALPEWLSDISSLKKLTIWECTSIKSLPSCIQQLTNLQEIFIFGNKELGQWCTSEENKAMLAHIKDVGANYLLTSVTLVR